MKKKSLYRQGQTEFNSRLRSFQYALEGWWYVIHTQRNAWIHAGISVFVFLLAWLLHISWQGWALTILAMMSVWMAEFFNTALEAIVDMVTPEFHPLAKIAKDVGAATVLVGALGATLIGLLVFLPPLWQQIQQWILN